MGVGICSIVNDQRRAMNQSIGYLIEYDIDKQYDMGAGQNPIYIVSYLAG